MSIDAGPHGGAAEGQLGQALLLGLALLCQCLLFCLQGFEARRLLRATPLFLLPLALGLPARLLELRRITLLSLVPTMLRRLLDLLQGEEVALLVAAVEGLRQLAKVRFRLKLPPVTLGSAPGVLLVVAGAVTVAVLTTPPVMFDVLNYHRSQVGQRFADCHPGAGSRVHQHLDRLLADGRPHAGETEVTLGDHR